MFTYLRWFIWESRQGVSLKYLLSILLITTLLSFHTTALAEDSDAISAITADPAIAQMAEVPQTTSSEVKDPVQAEPPDQAASAPVEVPEMVKAISDKYHRDQDLISKIVRLAIKYSQPVFPTTDDILSIIVVESQFNPRARNRASKGLMQINTPDHKIGDPYDIEQNIKMGVAILQEYFQFFKGNKRAAILAYNCGPGNYLRGRSVANYYNLYLKAKRWITSQPTDLNLV